MTLLPCRVGFGNADAAVEKGVQRSSASDAGRVKLMGFVVIFTKSFCS